MKEQLERDIKILREAKHISINNHDFHSSVMIKALETRLTEKLKHLDTKEQREFKNKDFRVKVWQDSEKIGIETVWIREGFNYDGELVKIGNTWAYTRVYEDMCYFTTEYNRLEDCNPKTQCNYSYSDIVTELEKADKLSREKEVTIWDVIEECKGVVDKEGMTTILDKYEVKYIKQCDWRPLSKNVHILDQPLNFTAKGHQLRLKEEK